MTINWTEEAAKTPQKTEEALAEYCWSLKWHKEIQKYFRKYGIIAGKISVTAWLKKHGYSRGRGGKNHTKPEPDTFKVEIKKLETENLTTKQISESTPLKTKG